MALTVRTLPLTLAQTRAARRTNAVMAIAPRLKLGGWRLQLGVRLNPIAARAAGRLSAASLKRRGVTVSSTSIGPATQPIPLRILQPSTPPRALIVDFHGGGWVIGSAALNDPLTGHFAEAGFAVASVDYRLLDEARQIWVPDAVEDCVAALRWALDEGRTQFGVDDVFLIGESAGAHLAALALLKLRDEGASRLPACIFVQGVFDLSGTPSVRAAGREALLFDGPNLTRDLGLLTPGLDEAGRRHPDLSPLYADLGSLPPALFVMGEADPLRDDSILMAEAWGRHNTAALLDVPTAPHGFQHFGAPTAALVQSAIRDWISDKIVADGVSVENTNR
ncbi:MAG TPA: alpha/beta hydrolase fold domain-containing protein [Brevundimonas sp.]|jgi:acetyl esterase/lipase